MIAYRAEVEPATRAQLERELAPLRALDDVVRWGAVEDVIVQDEYTHDVLVPWREGRYLVFDTT